MQRNLIQLSKNLGRSKDPELLRASVMASATELGHKPVWDGKFCHCANPGCSCKGWANHHSGKTDGSILNTSCVSAPKRADPRTTVVLDFTSPRRLFY